MFPESKVTEIYCMADDFWAESTSECNITKYF